MSSFGVLEAHRLEIIPASRVLNHCDPMLVAQDDAGAVEDTPDGRIELARDLRLRSPDRAQDRGDVEGRDLVDRTIKQRAGIGRTEMTLPLVADLRIDRLGLRVLDDELRDVLERRDRLGRLPGGSVGFDRVDPAGNELPRLARPLAGILEADRGIGAEALVLPCAGDLVAQDPFLASRFAHDEVEAVAVAMPARFCRLHPSFRQPRHPQSHIRSHTSKRIVAHSSGQGKTSPRVSHRIRLRLRDDGELRRMEV